MTGALDGVRVVDLTTMISGPLATRILADQGADVIKVERVGSGDLVRHMGAMRDGVSATFATVNRNKRSLALDLKSDPGRQALLRLIESSDVFVQNFRPGAIERMGLGEDELRRRNPRLVYVSISGFGETGPYAHKRVYDPVVQALSGLATIQADRDSGRPRMMRLIIPDKLTGVTAAQAITAALFARERGAGGQHVRLSMLDAAIAFQWPEGMASHTWVGEGTRGARARFAQDLVFETADGYITAGAVSDDEWNGLCRAVERPDWLEDERFSTAAGRVLHAGERMSMLQEVLRQRTSEEWLRRFESEDVPCAPILSKDELLSHPQIVANDLIHESRHPRGGAMRQPRPAERLSATPSGIRGAAPALGEHTRGVLADAGLSEAEIGELLARGVAAA